MVAGGCLEDIGGGEMGVAYIMSVAERPPVVPCAMPLRRSASRNAEGTLMCCQQHA